MQGYTGSFAINGVNLTLQPSSFQWEELELLGRNGQGRAIYPAQTTFLLNWGLMSTQDLDQIIGLYDTVSVTGTAVVDLPEWGHADYYFKSYSGTLLNRPTVGEYFNTYVTDVKLVVTKIRV